MRPRCVQPTCASEAPACSSTLLRLLLLLRCTMAGDHARSEVSAVVVQVVIRSQKACDEQADHMKRDDRSG